MDKRKPLKSIEVVYNQKGSRRSKPSALEGKLLNHVDSLIIYRNKKGSKKGNKKGSKKGSKKNRKSKKSSKEKTYENNEEKMLLKLELGLVLLENALFGK